MLRGYLGSRRSQIFNGFDRCRATAFGADGVVDLGDAIERKGNRSNPAFDEFFGALGVEQCRIANHAVWEAAIAQAGEDLENVFAIEGLAACDGDHDAARIEIFGDLVDDRKPLLRCKLVFALPFRALAAAIATSNVASPRDFEKQIAQFVRLAVVLHADLMTLPHHLLINHRIEICHTPLLFAFVDR